MSGVSRARETPTSIREQIRACPSDDLACVRHTRYLTGRWPRMGFEAPESHHPLLPDAVDGVVRVFVLGIQPGNAPNTAPTAEYLRANANESPLGWYTGRVLTEWLGRAVLRAVMMEKRGGMLRVDHESLHAVLSELDQLWPYGAPAPISHAQRRVDQLMREFRRLAGVYGTNVVKCHTAERHDDDSPTVAMLASACAGRYLARELIATRPDVVMPLGVEAARWLAEFLGPEAAVNQYWAEQRDPDLGDHALVLSVGRKRQHPFFLLPYFHPAAYAHRPRRIDGSQETFRRTLAQALLVQGRRRAHGSASSGTSRG